MSSVHISCLTSIFFWLICLNQGPNKVLHCIWLTWLFHLFYSIKVPISLFSCHFFFFCGRNKVIFPMQFLTFWILPVASPWCLLPCSSALAFSKLAFRCKALCLGLLMPVFLCKIYQKQTVCCQAELRDYSS